MLLATSKHNVQYLLGGHRAFFFDYMDAMGLTRYLPIMVYPKGKPDKAAYFGHRLERLPEGGEAVLDAGGADQLVGLARHHGKGDRLSAQGSGVPAKRIGIEMTFMPMDAGARCARACRTARSRMRCSCWSACALRKSPEELAHAADAPPSR